MAPDPDRYREIQQALAQKGYYKNTPTGNWDTESQGALKKFQEDQNLEPSGKLDSLTLIALGLGPKRGPTASPSTRPAPPPQQ
jgi:peptidoglycan hydrolase-like protein with peptidoglycan-binding domain